MGGFTSLNTAVSGLQAASLGLAITGHNMANSEVAGYSRQRIIQKEAYYQRIGNSAYGALRRGLGTDTGQVQQVRNQFLDITYRTQLGKLNFYAVKSVVGAEVEGLLGEGLGSYRFQDVVNDIWESLQELSMHPEGIETRYTFLANCQTFLTKSNEVYNSLFEYQYNLDQQIRENIMGENGVNALVSRVKELNVRIAAAEASGDTANDYRDERNLCLDQLSGILTIECFEDAQGYISIFSEGHQLLSQNSQNFMGLKYVVNGYSFVEPIFTTSKSILPATTPPSQFEAYMNYTIPLNANRDNDNGSLKALMVARGAMPAYYNGIDGVWKPLPPSSPPTLPANATPEEIATYNSDMDNFRKLYPDYDPNNPTGWDPTEKKNLQAYEAAVYCYQACKWSMDNALIPKTMMALDSIVHNIVTLINNALAPYSANGTKDTLNAPHDLYGDQSFEEIFTREYVDRWNANDEYNPEIPGNYYSQYSIGNLKINDRLINTEGGYNYISLSKSGDREDQRLLEEILDQWNSDTGDYAVNIDGIDYSVRNAYHQFLTKLAVEFQEANKFVEYQTTQVNQADNQRHSIMGVSLDEEMSNMMKYQYAYSAAARILNVVDSMLNTIINGLVR